MTIRSLLTASAIGLGLATLSSGAMAQTLPSLPSSGSAAIAILGIGIAVFVAHRIRKK